MDSYDKKRCRKAKLVPRDFVDSDDELKELQNEVEQTLARIKGDKPSTSSTQKQPQFSIKVEVEECDEGTEEVLEVPSSDDEDPHEINAYNLDPEEIIDESKRLVRKGNIVHRVMHMEIVNLYKKSSVPHVKSNHEAVLDKALQRWRDWFSLAEDLREPPLLYKCYLCNVSWWNLSEFREHIHVHAFKTFRISLEIVNCVVCNIVAHNKTDKSFIDPGGECWRCGELGEKHKKQKKCAGCSKDLFSCMKLVEHQWYCDSFKAKNIKIFQNAKKMYKCHLCPRYYFQEQSLFDHMVYRHSVRSDVPQPWTATQCKMCQENVPDLNIHACPNKFPDQLCNYCEKLFHTKTLLGVHKYVFRQSKACGICERRVYKECMKVMHMSKHTEDYVLMYKCLLCCKAVVCDSTILASHSEKRHDMVEGSVVPHHYIILPKRYIQNQLKKIKVNEPAENPGVETNTVINERAIEIAQHEANNTQLPIENIGGEINRNDTTTTEETQSTSKLCNIEENDEIPMEMDVDENICMDNVIIKQEKDDCMDCDNSVHNSQECIDAVNNLLNIKTEVEVEMEPIICNVASVRSVDFENDKNQTVTSFEEISSIDSNYGNEVNETELTMPINKDTNSINIPNPVANIEIKVSYQNEDLKIKEEPLPDEIQDVDLKLSDIRKIYHIDLNLSADPTNEINIKQEINEIDMNGKCENNWELLSNVFENFNEVRQETDDEFENDLIIIEPKEEIFTIESDDEISSSDPEAGDETEKKKRQYQCRKCEFTGVHKEYAAHKKVYCPNRRRSPRPDVRSTSFPCTTCATVFKTFRRYIRHFSVHGYPKYACPQCFVINSSTAKLEKHVLTHVRSFFVSYRSIKVTKGTFRCKMCEVAVDRVDFFEHWERHLEIKAWTQSEVCVKQESDCDPGVKKIVEVLKFPDKMSKVLSMKRACIVCDRRFHRRNDCVRHILEHLLTDAFKNKVIWKRLKCQICGEMFDKPEGFRRHLRFHASLPVYKCELCDKTFSDSSNFSKHKKVHNLKVLICDICTKKFNNKMCLIKHIEGHKNEEPLPCEYCGKQFFSRSMHRKHVAMHDKFSLKFRCAMCDIRFLSLRHKWDHMWLVHKERSIKADCPICGAEFRKLRDVKQHMDKMHDQKAIAEHTFFEYCRLKTE